jgi:hypothetical protein
MKLLKRMYQKESCQTQVVKLFMIMLHANVKEIVTYSDMLNSSCEIVYENAT